MNIIRSLFAPLYWRPLALLMAGLALLGSLAGCGQDAPVIASTLPGTGEKAVPVKTETVAPAPLELILNLTGVVEAARIAQLASPAEGPVIEVRGREGDHVYAGQILLTLGRTEGANALTRALREDLKREEDNLARTRQLVETGALAGEQLDIAQAGAERVRTQYVKAQEAAGDYAIAAPWDGILSKMKVRDGDFVAPRAPLAEIYDPKSLIVRIAVPEQEVAAVAQGMTARIELDAYPGESFAGVLTRLYPTLDPQTRTRTAELALTEPPELLPGMFARISLVRSTIVDAMTVPAHCLVTLPGGGTAVYAAQDGKAVRRLVETGIEINGRVLIVTGLQAGDEVIVAGHEKLKDGALVRVIAGDDMAAGETAESKASRPAVLSVAAHGGQL